MASNSFPPLVSPEWLAVRLNEPDLKVLDASWYLPASRRDAKGEFLAGHIPGAVFVDLDELSASDPLPHMLPSAEQFARQMGEAGVADGDRVVVYDGSGVNLSAPRVWWMLRAFGHREAAVLNGGFGKWRKEGRPVQTGPATPVQATFTAELDPRRVRDLAAMRDNLTNRSEQVLDARGAGRFAGSEPEPRAGMRSGHIPGSRSLPYTDLVAADGTLLPREELRERFIQAGIDLDRPIVTTCGSGVTACSLALGLELLGRPVAGVYDGSWSEWGGRDDTPVDTGPA